MKIRFFFAWFDFWVGLYWDRTMRTLYVCPFPMVVFALHFWPRCRGEFDEPQNNCRKCRWDMECFDLKVGYGRKQIKPAVFEETYEPAGEEAGGERSDDHVEEWAYCPKCMRMQRDRNAAECEYCAGPVRKQWVAKEETSKTVPRAVVVIRRCFVERNGYNVLIEGEGLPAIAVEEAAGTAGDICRLAHRVATVLGLSIGLAETHDGPVELVTRESVSETADGLVKISQRVFDRTKAEGISVLVDPTKVPSDFVDKLEAGGKEILLNTFIHCTECGWSGQVKDAPDIDLHTKYRKCPGCAKTRGMKSGKPVPSEKKPSGMADDEKFDLLKWILKKWDIPEDATEIQILGAMNVAHSDAHGFRTYIVSHRCEDKQGEIARQTVRADKAEAVAEAAVCGLQEIAAKLYPNPAARAGEVLSKIGIPIEPKKEDRNGTYEEGDEAR